MFNKLKFWKKSPEQKVEETPQLPSIGIAALLVTMMQESMKEMEKERLITFPDITTVRNEYLRLKRLGLENTKNALKLKAEVDKVQVLESRKIKAQEMVHFVKAAIKSFGEKTILISNQAFWKVLQDYNLETGLLQNYKGVIPPENIKDLERVSEAMDGFPFLNLLGKSEEGNVLLRVTDISYYYSEERTFLRPVMRKYYGCVPLIERYLQPGKVWEGYIDSTVGAKAALSQSLGKMAGWVIGSRTFMIACPEKYLKKDDVKISSLPIDPIIFQPCPYGVLIHTVWGDEAESEVLKRYLEVTQKINEM